ncbi:MAG: DUF5658 family protein [Patescibacteria group bacterium]
MNIWILAVCLQILDLLTTLIGLLLGGREVAPLAKFFITNLNPFVALVVLKFLALSLLFLFWRINLAGVVIKSNYVFMAIIMWNLIQILIPTYQALRP